ncbi:MAG: VWA domain-containing protein [bacterium]|nr:VWA domain-containing protein [bacterium]
MIAVVQEALESTAEARLEWAGYALSDPWFLAVVPVAVCAAALGLARRRYAPGRVPSLAAGLPRTLRQRLLWIPDVVRFVALVLVIFALARPLRGNVEMTSTSEGIDIVMLLDRSSSMEKRENPSRQSPRRFDIARDVMSAFATRRMNDVEGASDNVGLIGFAKYPELLCPFTLDSDALNGVLAELDTVRRRDMDGTGIGLAVAKSVEVLKNSEAKSRVVILLTDGEETIGKIMPMAAAQMAAEQGVKVYTVFAGPRYVVRSTLMSSQPRIKVPVPVGDLPEIAEMTGAEFFHAETAEELEEVYTAIEDLERTEREEQRFAEHFDLYPRFLFPAILLYLFGWLSTFTWARRLP